MNSAATSDLLGPSSPLAPFLPRFEYRPQQEALLAEINESFISGDILLSEAGTGVGKSLAYLIPAILWAGKRGERIVISTHTIALQEQLLNKDLPDLISALDIDIDCTIVKGMHHYLCLSRLSSAIEHHPAITSLGAKLRAIEANAAASSDDLRKHPAIRAEREHCNGPKCAHFHDCHFYKARARAEKAEVLIVNHHILLLDYLRRLEDPNSGILPDYSRLIVDEAHHLDKVAMHIFAHRLSLSELSRTLGDLAELDLPATLVQAIHTILIDLTQFSSPFEDKVALEDAPLPSREIIQTLKQKLIALEVDLASYSESKKEPLKTELSGYGKKCGKAAELIDELLLKSPSDENVRWAESTRTPLPSYCEALIDVSEKMRAFLKEPTSVLLTSATLTNGGSFDYFLERIGLTAGEVTTTSHPSPFDFERQSKLFLPDDLPMPNEPHFVKQASALIEEVVHLCKGGAFILCTSYRQLDDLYEALEERLSKYTLLRQGEQSRTSLLEAFRRESRPVLFATSSFWEGVDVAGSMRAVIIPKLPFQVPTDPHTQAHYKMLEAKGKSPFAHQTLPDAQMRLTQGLGRLIRTKQDRGIALCLDVRLHKRGYGKKFLEGIALPKKRGPSKELLEEIREFWASHM